MINEFSLFTKLQYLFLDNNKIYLINDDVQLPNLQTCSLINNQLQTIPKKFFESPNLNSLILTNNRIVRATLYKMEGYDKFNENRLKRINKSLQGNVVDDRDICGLTM